jgi:hypothetical protein
MIPYRAVLLALVVIGGALTAAAVPTGATGVAVGASDDGEATAESVEDAGLATPADATDARPTAAANDTTNNSTLGADISSFMQSNAAEIDGAVETGMWTAAFNATENQSMRAELVERRTSELREELADLQQRKRELVAEHEEGNITEVAYKAKISRLLGQINAFRSAIDATSARAEQTNVSVESLDTLRTESENLTGPEIASAARNTTGVGIDNWQGGPPSEVGNDNGVGNGATDGDNETTGTPGDVGDGTNESSSGGPPDDVGNSPIADDDLENETPAPNGSVPGTPPGTEAGFGASSDSRQVVTSTVVATPDLLGSVSDALGVRTYAFDYALTFA